MLDPDIAELIERAIENRLQSLFTADLGIVQTYDPAARTVDVIPVAHRSVPVDDEGALEPEVEPIRPNVPVWFPRSALASIEYPVSPGDTVLLVTLTRGVTPWRLTGVQVPNATVDQGLHHPGNCVALVGLRPDVLAMAGDPASVLDLVITSAIGMLFQAVTSITLEAPTVKLGGPDAVDPVANGASVDAELAAISTALAGASPPIVYTPGGSVGFLKVKGE